MEHLLTLMMDATKFQGKQPTSRSSAAMVYRREGERGTEEDTLYMAGGSDRKVQSACVSLFIILLCASAGKNGPILVMPCLGLD